MISTEFDVMYTTLRGDHISSYLQTLLSRWIQVHTRVLPITTIWIHTYIEHSGYTYALLSIQTGKIHTLQKNKDINEYNSGLSFSSHFTVQTSSNFIFSCILSSLCFTLSLLHSFSFIPFFLSVHFLMWTNTLFTHIYICLSLAPRLHISLPSLALSDPPYPPYKSVN